MVLMVLDVDQLQTDRHTEANRHRDCLRALFEYLVIPAEAHELAHFSIADKVSSSILLGVVDGVMAVMLQWKEAGENSQVPKTRRT